MGSYAALNKIWAPQFFWMIYFSLLHYLHPALLVFFHLAEKHIVSLFMKQCIHMHKYIYIHIYMHLGVYILINQNMNI